MPRRHRIRVGPARLSFALPDPPAGGGGGSVVAAALQRFDGGSGTARFRGTVPLAPGVAPTTADLDDIRVTIAGSEPAGGIWIEALGGSHPDGSIVSAYIEFDHSVADASPVTAAVEIGTPRTVADLGSRADAVERSPRSWLAAPTLFAITDPYYLCAARVAPRPLVPLSHPNVPAGWYDLLTTRYDADNLTTSGGSGSAGYDEIYPLACRYLCTGSLADLYDFFRRYQSDDYGLQRTAFSYTNPAIESYTPEMNPSDYYNENASGLPNEPYNRGLSSLICYRLCGWEYARLLCAREAAWQGWGGVSGDGSTPIYLNGNNIRRNFRLSMQSALLGGLIGWDATVASSLGGWSWDPATRPVPDVLAEYLDAFEYMETTLTAPYMAGVWGFSQSAVDAGDQVANFQFMVCVTPLIATYLHFLADARIPAALDAIAAYQWAQTGPALPTSVAGYPLYPGPYALGDPAAMAADPVLYEENAFQSTTLSPIFAWKAARSGDPDDWAFVDHIVDPRHWMYDHENPEAIGRKELGEWATHIFHTLAWRCGVPWDGWEVP